MTVTLKDVALQAGVSAMTVSNVIHGYTHVSPGVRQRVLAAIEELHYQPNFSARYLRTKRVGVLAFAVPDLSNAYYFDVGNSVIHAAEARSYTVLIDHTGGERANELRLINGFRPHMIEGVILNPVALERYDIEPQRVAVPLVLLGEHIHQAPCDHVYYDNVSAAYTATRHLLDLGRRRIAAIGPQTSSGVSNLRFVGYSDALTEAGLPLDPQLIIRPSVYNRSQGAQAMEQLLALDQPPDALFCFNDLLALGAIRKLHESGYRIPEDIAIIGFDNNEAGIFSTPSLTTITPDKKQIGELAVSLLLSRIDQTRTGPPEHIAVPFQLIVRESTVGPNIITRNFGI